MADIVRSATLGSYGVSSFAGGPVARLLGRLGLAQPGLRDHASTTASRSTST